MSNDKPSATQDDIRYHFDALISTISNADTFSAEVFQARQSFHERLILLNSATLTLLFTIVGGLSAHAQTKTFQAHDGYLLLQGSYCLIAAVICSLLHNHFNISFLIHSRAYNMILRALRVNEFTRANLAKSGLSPARSPSSNESTIADMQNRSGHGRKGSEALVRFFGPAAQIATVTAYIYFVRALHDVITTLFVAHK